MAEDISKTRRSRVCLDARIKMIHQQQLKHETPHKQPAFLLTHRLEL